MIRSAILVQKPPTTSITSASVRLATLAKEAGVKRFLLASSCSNYGIGRRSHARRNRRAQSGHALRQIQGAIGARHRQARRRAASVPVYCVRPPPTACRRASASTSCSTIWWPGRSPQGCIYLKSDGSPWRPIVHIEDISRAFIAALEAPEDAVFNEAFNVGQTAHNYRIRDIAEIVAEVVPGCRVEIAPDAGPDTRSYRVNFDKIARVLPAFKPQWDARRGAEQLSTRPIVART